MKDIFLVNYSVKGIKTLDELVSLSFYKKTISKNFDVQEYNVKGIYGMNGSGKSGIITSVDILRNILVNPGYLNNPIVQKHLDAIVNKELSELYIEVDFITELGNALILFRYKLKLSKNKLGKYVISYEQLSSKKATAKTDVMDTLFEVIDGEIKSISSKKGTMDSEMILQKTLNLLTNTSLCALFYEKRLITKVNKQDKSFSIFGLLILFIFGKKLHVYLDKSDDHREYLLFDSLQLIDENENYDSDADILYSHFWDMDAEILNEINVTENIVNKARYNEFELTVDNLYKFIHIFKTELKNIEIDRKEDRDAYNCSLIMVYDSYKIHAEFESTGIKKLIKIYPYLREMVKGGIVFIDEFDSNLHDVYLCALLEYLMGYAKGQLCFTTHNVGPMDILKQNKKSIDFLSTDGKIYPWKTNGNYSPSKLYRNGMIEGSPFNVDSIDFIGVFELSEGDE